MATFNLVMEHRNHNCVLSSQALIEEGRVVTSKLNLFLEFTISIYNVMREGEGSFCHVSNYIHILLSNVLALTLDGD